MSSKDQEVTVRLDLTREQRAKVMEKIGQDVEAIELTVEELEARITPKVALNHNESLLTDDIE